MRRRRWASQSDYLEAGLLAAIVLACVGAVVAQTWSSDFVLDDLLNLRRAQLSKLSFDYLFEPTSGHFAPGHSLGDWLLQRYFPFDFRAAQAFLAAGLAVILVLFHRLVVELRGRGMASYALTFALGASMVNVGVAQWWASGLDRVPATALALGSMVFYLRFRRSRSPALLAASVVTLLIGLLFYVKPVFVPFYLLLLRVLVLEPHRRLRETLGAAVREWRVWAAYGVPVAMFSILYVKVYPSYVAERGTAVLAEYLRVLWFRVVAPNLLGLYVPKGDLGTWASLGVVLAQVGFFAAVIWTVRNRRGAWRSWAFFVLAAVPNAVIVGLTRVGYNAASDIAYATFFNYEIFLLLAVALAVALPAARPPGRARVAPGPRRRLQMAALAAYAGLSGWGGWALAQPDVWVGAQARTYFDNLRHGLAQLRESGAPAAFVDGTVPEAFVPALGSPSNNHSEVVPLLLEGMVDGGVSFDVSGDGGLVRVTPAGLVERVVFEPVFGGGALALLEQQQLGVAGGTVEVRGSLICIAPGPDPATFGVTPPEPLTGDLYAEVTFQVLAATIISVFPEPRTIRSAPRYQYEAPRLLEVREIGYRTRVYSLESPRVEKVVVAILPPVEVCVDRIVIGRLRG